MPAITSAFGRAAREFDDYPTRLWELLVVSGYVW
jgi:hypothetical protein